MTDVTEVDARLVQIARDHGAAAKLCGSGGSVVVVPRRDTDVASLDAAFALADFLTCRPTVS
jgi:mevalonate kinase